MIQTSKRGNRTWILVLTSVAAFMVGLDALVVATALSTIRLQMDASIESLEWIVNAYTLSFAVLLMTGAVLGDRFGRRRLFIIGLALFTVASAACGLSSNVNMLIAMRAIQGCGAALVMPLALTQLSVAFPPEMRGRALGIFSGVAGLAVLAGPVVGGAIVGGLPWQWIFWLNVPVGLLMIPLVLLRIPESTGKRETPDIAGLLLITGAALGLVWGLVRGNQIGWGSSEVLVTLSAGLLLVIAFILWELRTRTPMLSLRAFRSRAFSAGNTVGFLFFAALYGSTFFLAQFFQTVLGYGPLGAGLRLLPLTAMLFLNAPLAGTLTNRLGERTLIVVGTLLQGIAFAWIALIARPGLAYPALIAPLIIAGFGAWVIPASQNAVVSAVALAEIGKASGTFNMLRQLGAAFGVAILAAVFAGSGNFSSAQAFNSGFIAVMVGAAALSIIAAIAGLLLPGKSVAASARTAIPTSGPEKYETYVQPEQAVTQ